MFSRILTQKSTQSCWAQIDTLRSKLADADAVAQHIIELHEKPVQALQDSRVRTGEKNRSTAAAYLGTTGSGQQVQMGIAGTKQLIGQQRIIEIDPFLRR